MAQTAYSVLLDSSGRHAIRLDRTLKVFFEQSGRREDRELVRFHRDFKTGRLTSAGFPGRAQMLMGPPLSAVLPGEPRRRTKQTPMIQIADLILYAVAKGGYDPDYRPYRRLQESGKLVVADNLVRYLFFDPK